MSATRPAYEIALCYGTRPQIIKASLLRRALAGAGSVRSIDSGQHYDYELNALLYRQLGVEPPDLALGVGSGSAAAQTAAILTLMEAALREFPPKVVVVIGDTNSTLGATLAAVKLRIPVVHVEAGLRSADALMPEEINRRMVDSVSSVLCTPSARASERVRAERIDAIIVESGDVARDVLEAQWPQASALQPAVPIDLKRPFYFATLHRAELTDHPSRLHGVLRAMAALDHPVLLALHPRTREILRQHPVAGGWNDRITLTPPVGYHESLALVAKARAVLTDSGGVQREAYWLGTPCVTLRRETEWQETVNLGANLPLDPAAAEQGLAVAIEGLVRRWDGSPGWDRSAYGTGDAASRIAQAVARCMQPGELPAGMEPD